MKMAMMTELFKRSVMEETEEMPEEGVRLDTVSLFVKIQIQMTVRRASLYR